MSSRFTKATVGVAALTLALGAAGLAGAASASAATPPYEPDPNAIGSLSFFDASGNQVSGGNITDAPFAAYIQASTAGRAGDTKASLFGALPKNGVASGAWTNEQISGSTTYPNASAPGALGTSSLPLVTLTSGDETLASLATDLPNTATDAYKGLYQLRIKTSGTGQPPGSTYDAADILITGSTWQVVYPGATSTATTLAVTPASPQLSGTSVTLTATVSPSAAGTVQFKDGSTSLGSPVAVSGGTASYSTTALSIATHTLTAVFTPTNPALYGGSTSNSVSYEIDHAAVVSTSTALSVNPSTAPALTAVTLQANVTRSSDNAALGAADGSVTFYDGATPLGTTPLGATGASLSYSAFAVGTHQLTAKFTAADPATYGTSTSAQVPFVATAPDITPAAQDVSVTVPAGALTITTPYSVSNPFNLGSSVLDPNGTQITADAAFGSSSDPGAGITITDTRAGNQAWTASATVTDFTDGATPDPDVINGQNLTFVGVTPVYLAGNALQSGSVVTNDVTNTAIYGATDTGSDGLRGGPHVIATAAHGDGSVNIVGHVHLRAPTSTVGNAYSATLTFTVA